MVYFVGAGTGAADLITVRGMRLLERADVIIYAGSLVNPELLAYAGKTCEIHNSAKLTLDEVIEIMKEADKQGKMIVRLHTGDQSVYGAVREQMDELDRLGIAYESCPGVSACFGAAASLNLEYTLPGCVPVPDYYENGRKDCGAGERKHRKFCGTSGIHGNLPEYRTAGRTGQKTDGGRIPGRYPCSTLLQGHLAGGRILALHCGDIVSDGKRTWHYKDGDCSCWRGHWPSELPEIKVICT